MSRRSVNPLFWTLAQVGSRLRVDVPASLDATTEALPDPQTVQVPTRHGAVRSLVQRAPSDESSSPVVLHMHGGGFVNRYPEQDRYIARFLAAQLGVTVVLPDYATAPKARYPVAEEQMLDVARWLQSSGDAQRWDGDRLLLSGISAGAKLAVNVCQQLHALDASRPLAAALVVPVTDFSRTDRTSSIARPAISPLVQRFVNWAYFPDASTRREPLASPRFDGSLPAAMPPTVVLTAQHDTLAAEGAELAHRLRVAGVETAHDEFPGVDHGFIAGKPAETVHAALGVLSHHVGGRRLIGDRPAQAVWGRRRL